MSVRINTETKAPAAVVVSAADFAEDLKRGYTVLEHDPERIEIIKDRRSTRTIERRIPAALKLACMRCQWDTLAGVLLEREDGEVITGESLMEKHLACYPGQEHPWSYKPFVNPYGHIEDVVIEGIADDVQYCDYIKEL